MIAAIPISSTAGRSAPAGTFPAQRYAKVAAVLFLISAVIGGIGEAYVPLRLIVSNDPAATAANVRELNTLFRLGFATYLIEALADVALAVIFYYLLRPVDRTLALLTAFLGLISTTLYAVSESFYFAPSLLLGGAKYLTVFSPEQINALVLLSFRMFQTIGGLFLVFYGVGWMLRGYLIYRSGYLPKWLGVLLAIGGFGFVAQTFSFVLAPRYVTLLPLVPFMISGLVLMFWLFAKGIDAQQWEAAQRRTHALA